MVEKLLDLALRAGAEAAEVFLSQSHTRPVYFEANRLKQLESVESDGLCLRLWKRGRPGLAVAYGDVDPQDLVDRAIAISSLNPPEAIELSPSSNASYPDIGQAVPVDRLIEWGREAIDIVRSHYPEILCTAAWECEMETTRIANTYGLDASYTDTTLSSDLAAEWVRGEDFLSICDGQTQRDTLDSQELADKILLRLAWAQANVLPPTGRVPILFTSKAADLLWGTIQSALNGKRAIEKSSPWCDLLSDRVLSPHLTLSQHPDLGPYSCPFDDEGTPTRPIVFIEDGVLQLFYTDRRIGRILGCGSTGNGFRPGLEGYPTPGLFNLIVRPGSGSLDDLVSQLDDGLIVDEMLGGGGGLSGDFSINVALGYRVKNGRVIGRVKDTMVSGNVYTALRNLVRLGGDGIWNGSCYTPSLIVEGLSVTGRS
ncbi:peptidase C69 [Leptolyngbya valderiana BDU 20041]|nr:peptidase C69 [Leptolyngbya valderiana BDU 20041]